MIHKSKWLKLRSQYFLLFGLNIYIEHAYGSVLNEVKWQTKSDPRIQLEIGAKKKVCIVTFAQK